MLRYSQGLAKKFETFLFGAITDPTKFRKQLHDIIPLITTTTQALADAQKIADHKAQGHSSNLKLVGTNLAFSQTGLNAVRWHPLPYVVLTNIGVILARYYG